PELVAPVCPPERKDRGSNRKRPDSLLERRAAATRVAADSVAPAPRRSIPAANTNANRADLACSYFTVVAGLFGSNSVRLPQVKTGGKKNRPLKGEVLSGLVGDVLRGRRICYLSITATKDYSAQSSASSQAAWCRPTC